jgi:hypothetical protein
MKFLKDNGLVLTMLGIFLLCLAGQALTGWSAENEQRAMHGEDAATFGAFLGSGAFLSSVFENWESEFLEKWAFVLLTAWLYQRDSADSKDPDKDAPEDRDPAQDANKPDAPWPVRAGGFARILYSHSLGIVLLVLFLGTFALHVWNSARHAAAEALQHGQVPESVLEHLVTGQFWFESFQNWQSEFLSTGLLILLAIFLRERGSPESKPVADPHRKTGH